MSRPVLVAGAAQLLLLAALGWAPGARGTPFPALLLWGGLFALYLAAAAAQARRPAGRAVLWTGGLAMRACLLPLPPHFSDDVWRYLWDGRVQLAGVNPYAHAPADPTLEPLHTAWHALINHPEVPTIYPPGAQLLFLGLAALGPSVLWAKAAWVAADLGVAVVLDRLTRPRLGSTGSPRAAPSPALLLWLWSPLVLVEIAWSAHLEPVGILPMMAAVLVLRARAPGNRTPGDGHGRAARALHAVLPKRAIRGVAAGTLLGLAGAIKLAPLAGVPALGRRHGRAALAAALLVPLLLAVPYLDAGAAMLDGLRAYGARWRFHPGAFRLLEAVLGHPGARVAAAVAVVTVALGAAAARWRLERALLWAIGAALLLSPTLHPWYALWILPLAILRRSPAWILLSGLVFLGYAGLDAFRTTGAWPQPAWLSLLIHGPVLTLLAAEALTGSGRAAHPRDRSARRGQVPDGEQPGEGGGGEQPVRQ